MLVRYNPPAPPVAQPRPLADAPRVFLDAADLLERSWRGLARTPSAAAYTYALANARQAHTLVGSVRAAIGATGVKDAMDAVVYAQMIAETANDNLSRALFVGSFHHLAEDVQGNLLLTMQAAAKWLRTAQVPVPATLTA